MNKITIPATWRLGTLEDIVTDKQYSITGGPFGSDLQTKDYTSVGIQIIQLQNIGDGVFINKSKVYTSEEKANQLKSCNIYPRDIILAKMADPVARACIIPAIAKRFLMASDGIRVEVDKTQNDVYYIVSAINFNIFRKQAINKSTGTTRARIGLTDLKKIQFPIPPFNLQQKIARILTTVDNIIEKTKAAIAKYRVIKQGMMHDLFTHGIDVKTGKLRPFFEDAPELYKPSELGMIPKEWEVSRTEDISSRIWIGLVTTMTTHYVESGVKLIRNNNIRDSEISEKNMINLDIKFSEQNKNRYIHTGDIVTVHTGDIGTSAIITKEFNNSQGFATINTTTNKTKISNSFLCDYYNSHLYKRRIQAFATGDGRSNFNLYDYVEIKIPYPISLVEQNAISERINSIRRLIKNEQELLVKLHKQKHGLMQNLLTGKKEVVPDPEDFKKLED